MSTETQPWLRAELIAAPETTPGAQLMIPADGIEFHDDQLVFHNQGDIVYVASQGQLRSITWLAKQPNPATARRRAQWPNHGTRWTDEEREDLLRRLQAGQAWKTISTAHGRSRSGCQQEAVKQGWLDAETLQLKPEFLPDADTDARRTTPAPATAADKAPATASPNPATTDAEPYAPPSAESFPAARGLARHATRGAVPQASSQPGSSHVADAAPASTAEPPAEPPAGPQPPSAPAFATAAPPPTTLARTTAASPSAPHSTDPRSGQPSREAFSGSHTPDPNPGSATLHPDPGSSQPSPEVFSGSQTPDPNPGSTTPHPDPHSSQPRPEALAGPPARSAISLAEPSAPDAFSSPLAAETAEPNPDRPRFPPRVPRQRINPDNLPGPAPERDSGPDSEPGPRPGSRFFSRAQSSLARATLGAYMTPPRGESGAAPGAT